MMNEMFVQQIRRHSRPLPLQKPILSPRLRRLPELRAVFFSVYGTCFLCGTADSGTRAESLTESLREQGVDMDPDLAPEALERFFELIQHAREAGCARGTEFPDVRILDIWEQWRREAGVAVDVPRLAIDMECRLNPVWPMPGLIHTLEQLQAAGFRLGIVSNAQVFTPSLFPALTNHSLEDLGFGPAHCVWSWRLQEAKPSRRLFDAALRSVPDLRPQQCLFVGSDLHRDIVPAAAAGMRTALFAGGTPSLNPGTISGALRPPDLILQTLPSLLDCLEECPLP